MNYMCVCVYVCVCVFVCVCVHVHVCVAGMFDILGSSHQWWHVIIVLSMLWWRAAVLHLAHFRHASNTCGFLQ